MDMLKYLILAIPLIICNASATDVNSNEMTLSEIHDALKDVSGITTDAWRVSGEETRSPKTSCLENRVITIYEKPIVYKRRIVKTKTHILVFTPPEDMESEHCGKLAISKKQMVILGKYGNETNANDLNGFFEIHGRITDKELLQLESIMGSIQNCLSASVCSSIKIRNIFSKEDARLRAITINNIASIEKRPKINGIQSYMILFKSYPENELAITVYGIASNEPQVDIGAVIP